MLSEKYMLQDNIGCAIILSQSYKYKYNLFDIVEFGDYLWKLIIAFIFILFIFF